MVFGSKNKELLEINFFLPSHIYLRSWQIIKFGEKKLGIIGDALRIGREELLGDSKKISQKG